MNNHSNQPSPEMILKVGTGFWPSQVLLTAVHFNLFTLLEKHGPTKAIDLKKLLNFQCTDRHMYDFLDVLTSLGFLNRDGLMDTAIYHNTIDTSTFLDKNKPSYMGGILEMMHGRLYTFWGDLNKALLSGKPQNEASRGQKPIFETLYENPTRLKGFVNAMTGMQVGNFMTLAQKFDFSKYKTFLDAGGSAGILSIMVAKHNSHIQCKTLDLPAVEAIANDTIKQHNISEQVEAVSADFFSDDLPQADVVAMGNILHDWNEAGKLKLMQKAYDALPDGGAFVAIEAIIDNDRRQNTFGMMMSLNMLIETEGGFDYSFQDFQYWAKQIGFKSTELMPLTGPSSAAIAYK